MTEKKEDKPEIEIEHAQVNPFDEHWDPVTLFKDIQYRILFENGNEFFNQFLQDDIETLMESQCGEQGKMWYVRYEFNPKSDYGVELYCQNTGWMVFTKLVDPENTVLPKIKKIEKRTR